MSGKGLADNPFAALFHSVDQAEAFRANKNNVDESLFEHSRKEAEEEALAKQQQEEEREKKVKHTMSVNSLMENVFLITIDKDFKIQKREATELEKRPARCVYLAELADTVSPQSWLDMECLEQAVFQRLLMSDPGTFVIATATFDPRPEDVSMAGESGVLRYLFHCYKRYRDLVNYKQFAKLETEREKCKEVILLNAKTCLQQCELYPTQQFHNQFLDMYIQFSLLEGDSVIEDFFVLVADEIQKNREDGTVYAAFEPVLDLVSTQLKSYTIQHTEVTRCINILLFFTKSPPLAKAFMDYTTPKDPTKGQSFETTLLGSILALSCVPKTEMGPYLFFEHPASSSSQEHNITEQNIWRMVSSVCQGAHKIVFGLIKSSADVRHQMLSWLGKCLHANSGRAKLWSAHAPQIFSPIYCSDGFSLNLCHIMLKLCQPFSEPCSPKLLKIQPSYAQAVVSNDQEAKEKNVHSSGLEKETCLIPSEGLEPLTQESSYTFITECFFMTHQAIHVGFHNVHDKFMRLNQELHKIENVYRELRSQSHNDEVEPLRSVKAKYEKGLTMYLTLKAALTEPQMMELCMKFYLATSTWLVQVARKQDITDFDPVSFPLPAEVPRTLACIPEFVMGNITDFTMFLHRFKDEMYQLGGDNLEHFMTLILVYMGSPERMKNPHFRAELAATVEALMPLGANKQYGSENVLSKHYREKLFKNHRLIDHLAEKLLHVFVSIEVTGEAVQFEQKFNYRQPMYRVLKYIWDSERHRNNLQVLATYAEEHIEDTNPPLFLRFINLLINDAIFLLDEGLDYMKQLKEKQQERDGEGGATPPQWTPQQRQEFDANYRQLEMLARIHNQLGNVTIVTLEMITREIKSIFCHSVMVDRMTSMLSDFLLRLVGPKQTAFKVQDMREKYHFRPDEIVSNICKIYVHFSDIDDFCKAVVREERSYSVELFPKALRVLQKIHSPPALISDFEALHRKVLEFGDEKREEEEIVAEAPEEYLDPIMGTLMTDPVVLPTSQNTVDRAIISRHLLSDQSDPFNRQPLSLDMVVPNTELKEEIHHWLAEQRARRKAERENRNNAVSVEEGEEQEVDSDISDRADNNDNVESTQGEQLCDHDS